MADTETKKISLRSPQCVAVDSSMSRCKHAAAWCGICEKTNGSTKIKYVYIELCEKHAKEIGWSIGKNIGEDE